MIDIVGKRYYFFALSILLILAGVVGFVVNHGLQLDIQFQGGTIIKVQMDNDSYDTAAIESVVKSELNKMVTAQKLSTFNAEDSSSRIYMLMLKVSSQEALSDDEIQKVFSVLRDNFGVKDDAQNQIQSVQPFIGKELMRRGLLAAVLASVLIIFYVWWRFSVMSGLSAAVMAVVALLHDAAIMLSVYAIFRVPLNESFVAAILTILGYSMNDTIIVYDRIRENSRLLRKVNLPELVNKSVVQTLARSINTLVTTLICIVTVFIFAAVNNIQSLKDFSLPLIVGLVSGGYSSIFIASPLWMMWKQSRSKKVVSSKPAKAK